MHPQNIDLLQSQDAIEKLVSRDLRGVFALRLANILEAVVEQLRRLQTVRQELNQRIQNGDLSEEEADEQWREVLEDTCEIDAEPIPRSAVRTIEISVADLKVLEWLFEKPPEASETEEARSQGTEAEEPATD
jgi:hypothetical protein